MRDLARVSPGVSMNEAERASVWSVLCEPMKILSVGVVRSWLATAVELVWVAWSVSLKILDDMREAGSVVKRKVQNG
jgi:hypothetical protein